MLHQNAKILKALAFKGLKKLTVTGGSDYMDLAPLTHLPLEELTCPEPMARKDGPVLKGIKTLKTINGRPAAEFWKQDVSRTR